VTGGVDPPVVEKIMATSGRRWRRGPHLVHVTVRGGAPRVAASPASGTVATRDRGAGVAAPLILDLSPIAHKLREFSLGSTPNRRAPQGRPRGLAVALAPRPRVGPLDRSPPPPTVLVPTPPHDHLATLTPPQ